MLKRSILFAATIRFACAIRFAGASQAAVKPNGLISDGAVLQQGIDLPIWGTADEREKITVKRSSRSGEVSHSLPGTGAGW